MEYDRLLAELDCMTPTQAELFNQAEDATYTGRAARAIRELRADLDSSTGYGISERERAREAEAAIARVRELQAHFARCPDVVNQTVAKSIGAALEGNQR